MQEVAGCGRLSDCEELVRVLTGGDGPLKEYFFSNSPTLSLFFHFEIIYIFLNILGQLIPPDQIYIDLSRTRHRPHVLQHQIWLLKLTKIPSSTRK